MGLVTTGIHNYWKIELKIVLYTRLLGQVLISGSVIVFFLSVRPASALLLLLAPCLCSQETSTEGKQNVLRWAEVSNEMVGFRRKGQTEGANTANGGKTEGPGSSVDCLNRLP